MPADPALIEKLNTLDGGRLAEVEDFVDFLRSRDRDRGLSKAARVASEPAFVEVWDNPSDAVYDAL